MLRSTVSKVKKVCSGAFIPRILTGNHCGGPASYAVVRKSFKSTKSTDDGKQDTLASEEDNDEKKSDKNVSLEDKSSTKCSRSEEPPSIPLTHRERCQRIIDKAFGACEHTDENPEMTQQYCSHNVDLEDTRRQIIESEREKLKLQEQVKIQNPLLLESRAQYGIFKMGRELIKDDNHDEVVLSKDSMFKVLPTAKTPKLAGREDLVKTLNIHMTTAEEPNLTKNLDNVGAAEDNAPLLESYSSNAKEDVEKCMNNPECVENKAFRHDDDAEAIEMVKDERKQYLYQRKNIPQEQIHTLLPYNRTQFGVYSLISGDEKQDEIILIDSTLRLPPVVGSQLAGREDLLTNAEEEEKCVHNLESVKNKVLHDDDSETIEIDKDERKHMFINATTAKEDEEQLTQKLEIIEETPLVEAQIPKIEGFNVTPRVLGDQPVFNSKSIEHDEDYIPRMPVLPKGDLDDVAKRCLRSPLGRIDEILLNEMEKRPFTRKTERHASSKALLRDILVQMDELKRQPNSTAKEQAINSESPKFKTEEVEPCVIGLISPTRHLTILETRLPDLNEETEEITLINPKEDNQPVEETVQAIEKVMDNTSPLKNTKLIEPIVTKIHVLGIGSMEDNERATNNVTTEATVSEEYEENYLGKYKQNVQCATDSAETERTHSKVTSFDSTNDASDDILRYERLLKPEYVTHFKGVDTPSYCGTVNASNYEMDELQSKEAENKSFYSRNLSTAYLWGHNQQNASASKTRNLQHEGETDEIEHGQRPQGQSIEEEGHEEITANRGFERIPYTNFRLPAQKWEKDVEHLPKIDKATPLGSQEKTYSVTDELLKEHELDPYYVLACNETCPIAPISSLSTYNHSDFVDTTETIYMKKNICESIRPKPLPRDLKMQCEKIPKETQALHELDVEFEPEVIPECGYIAMPPEAKSTGSTEAIGSPLKLSERLSLSELLKRVRQRNRLECMSDLKAMGLSVEPTVGKCNRKAPRCPPTAPRSPPLNPVPPPSFGLPMLKRRPPVCKTPKKKPGCKCTACDMDVSCGVHIGEICPEMAYELNEAEVVAQRSKVDLTEIIADRLHNLGKVISGVLRQAKSSAETFFARDYDPWAPIPSWPIPQKVEKKKWQPATPCNYRCPVYPKARASMNPEPPCELKPCQGMPKRRSFSMLDCLAVSLGDVKVK